MDLSLALHTRYRRALYERHEFKTSQYSQLSNGGRPSDDYHYTDEAKDAFSRYNVIEAVIDSIEELDSGRNNVAKVVHLRGKLHTVSRAPSK
jgi:hypothetical protein